MFATRRIAHRQPSASKKAVEPIKRAPAASCRGPFSMTLRNNEIVRSLPAQLLLIGLQVDSGMLTAAINLKLEV